MKKSQVFIFFCFLNGFIFSQSQIADSLATYPVNMTVLEFKERTSIKDKLVLVNFAADWCVMCKKQKPVLDQIKIEKKNKVDLIIIDMEENPLIAEYFNVDGLPVNLLYKNGNLVWDRAGFRTKSELLKQISLFEY